jgi:uncharacterized protein YidB (DUF937 family)
MGLLDKLLQMAGGAKTGTGKDQNAISSIIDLLNNQQIGGFEGLIGKFAKGNLGHIMDSWISTGQNKPVNANQLTNVLGSDVIGQLASKLGISHKLAIGQLVKFLPMIIDKFTPDGKVPSNSSSINVQDILGKLLK